MRGEWHFIDYPETYEDNTSEQVLCKLTDNTFEVCIWDSAQNIWYDTAYTAKNGEIACWTYIEHAPSTTRPMREPQ